jgi:choline dehydrogenase
VTHSTIIVGGGSAGAILAARLSEDPANSVLLIEAGPDYPGEWPADIRDGNNVMLALKGPHNAWGYTGIANEHQSQPFPVPRGKVLGGTSTLYAQVLLRGMPADYDEWAAQGNALWSYAEVLPYFLKLEKDLDFPPGPFHGGDGPVRVRRSKRDELHASMRAFYDACVALGFPADPDQNLPESTGIGFRPLSNVDGVRVNTAAAYLTAATRARPNLEIMPRTQVARILFEGKRAIGVETVEQARLHADRIIVSAGAIGSPHLLMLSGIGPGAELAAAGIPVVHDLPGVGRNLRDHPVTAMVFRHPSHGADPFGQPSTQVALRYTAKGSSSRNDLQIYPVVIPADRAGTGGTDDAFFLLNIALQSALGAGEVSITSSDPKVLPTVRYRYLAEPEDLRRMRDGFRVALEIAQRGFGDLAATRVQPPDPVLASDDALDQWLLQRVTTQHHSSGTCKMGSDAWSVVDQRLHVSGIEGLMVVDASVMPNVIRANSNATIMMIAERAAALF